jgi:hypothetical protein
VIVHLKNVVEMQYAELKEREETITNLKQQLLELQVQAPPALEDPDKIDVMSGLFMAFTSGMWHNMRPSEVTRGK